MLGNNITRKVSLNSWLTAVELVGVGVLLGLLVRSIGVGVGDAGSLAELAGARHVQGVDEEGRGGGGQDQAGYKSVR